MSRTELEQRHFIVIGVNKAGTTTLDRMLRLHPALSLPAKKENLHFLALRYGEELPPLEAYHQQFENAGSDQIRCEVAPAYLYGGGKLAEQIRHDLGENTRLRVVLRDPSSRFLSFFRFQQSRGLLPPTMGAQNYLTECSRYSDADFNDRELNPYFGLVGGEYARFLREWINVWGDSLTVTFTDDLKTDPGLVAAALFDDLGIEQIDIPPIPQMNKTITPKNRALHSIALRTNERLEVLWRKQPHLKDVFRTAYGRWNVDSNSANADEEVLGALADHYAPHLSELRTLLRECRTIGSEPSWLRSA